MLLLLLSFWTEAESLRGLVCSVTDGDTITVADYKGSRHRIRLYGIDAPESSQAYGQESRKFLNSLVYRKNVRVEYQEYDSYGRIIGTVFIGRRSINLEMVATGNAWHYAFFAPNEEALADAQEKARQAKKGLWSESSPRPPWQYRRSKPKSQNTEQQ